MDIEIKQTSNSSVEVIIKEETRLDLNTAVDFGTTVKDYVEDNDISKVVFDFGNINFISSFGFRVMLEIYRALQKPSEMIVKNASETIKQAIKMVGFDSFIKID